MVIKDEKTYREVNKRIDELIDKGTSLGDMDMLSDKEKDEFTQLTDAAYDWECQQIPHPWKIKPTLLEAIINAISKKGFSKKMAASEMGMSSSTLDEVLNGDRGITFDEAKNMYNNLGIPANVLFA